MFRLRGRLLNTFCVKLNVPEEESQLEETCNTMDIFSLPQTETAQQVIRLSRHLPNLLGASCNWVTFGQTHHSLHQTEDSIKMMVRVRVR